MNWKLIFVLPAALIEIPSVLLTGKETGFGNWAFDRELGDPNGKWWQTRTEALFEQDQNVRSR